jgi:hypothetical protein
MASTTYLGRVQRDGRRLGDDFDLLAKWTRTFSLDHPIHSYYLTQLSAEDRAQLFDGPAQQFRLDQGPNNTVKLETLQDEVDRLDPDVIDMIRSSGYQRSEARRFELMNEIDDAHDRAEGAAALALSGALLKGMDGPPAEKLARRVADRIYASAGAEVRARWKAERDARMRGVDNQTHDSLKKPTVASKPVSVDRTMSGAAPLVSRWRAIPEVPQFNKTISDTKIATSFEFHRGEADDNQTTPQQNPAVKLASPDSSIPDHGSETSSDSAHWDSHTGSDDESPSSPDLDPDVGFDDNGGVSLIPSSLAEELGLKEPPRFATPKPGFQPLRSDTQTPGYHLGAGLNQAFFTLPASINSMLADNTLGKAFNFTSFGAVPVPSGYEAINPLAAHVNSVEENAAVEDSSAPFSPNSKISKYPAAREQPWMGFSCYEVSTKFSNDQLVPKYWTTKNGKERYVRYKIGELKLDDSKLRSDRFAGSVARNPVHIFIDLSNIIIGFYDSMKENRGIPVNKRVMAPAFSFKNFDTILTRDRNVAKRIVAGSLANSYNKRWPAYMLQAAELKYEMNILERVPKPASPVRKRRPRAGTHGADAPVSGADTSGEECFVGPMRNGEQGVDELLHLKILQSAMDTTQPATMVLATGDAANAQYSDGFKKNIERVLAHGWNIELYGWKRNISSAWREPEFAEQWGHQFKIVELDGFCEELFDMTIESLEH